MTDAAETIAMPLVPTVERLRHARGREYVPPSIDQRVDRRASRLVSCVETMRKRGILTDGQWAAWERFEDEWGAACAQPRLIGRYGERAGSGGTPTKQLTGDALDAAERRDVRRSRATYKIEQALAVLPPRHRQAMEAAVSEDCGLEEIGFRVSRYLDRGKAIAVASSTIEDALWLLNRHYCELYGQA